MVVVQGDTQSSNHIASEISFFSSFHSIHKFLRDSYWWCYDTFKQQKQQKKETESKNKQLNVHSTQKLSSFFINLCKCVLCVLCFYVWSIRYKDAKSIIKLANKLNKLFLGIRCKSILIFETSTNRIFIVFDNKFIVIM